MRQGFYRALTQIVFTAVAAALCVLYVVVSFSEQYAERYEKLMLGKAGMLAESAALLIEPWTLVDTPEQTVTAYRSYLESVFSVSKDTPGEVLHYALFSFDGGELRTIAMDKGQKGPSFAYKDYRLAADIGEFIKVYGTSVHAVRGISDESGPIGALEVSVDYKPFLSFDAGVRDQLGIAAVLGIAAMIVTHILISFIFVNRSGGST